MFHIILYFMMLPILLTILPVPAAEPPRAMPGAHTSACMGTSSKQASARPGLLMVTRQPAALPIHAHTIPDGQHLDWNGEISWIWIFTDDDFAKTLTPDILLPAFHDCAAGIYMRC